MTDRRIIILGFMGSGKTTIARALARQLGSETIDLDEQIAQSEGRSAKQIIEADGESAFRKIETRVLSDALQSNSARIISLGGGTWTVEKNRALIVANQSTSVWLDAPFSLCWQRIVAAGDERPLARTEHEALTLYQKRRAVYQLADVRVEATENKSAEQVALEIAQAIDQREMDEREPTR